MIIVAIDPGSRQSAILFYDTKDKIVRSPLIMDNEGIRSELWHAAQDAASATEQRPYLVIEQIEHYGTGMHVGATIFDTCIWMGRFIERWAGQFVLLPRRNIKVHLCGSARAKEKNVRQALIDRFPATGGGKVPQIGIKKQAGPLYGIKSHLWSALAVAVTFADTQNE